MSNERLRIKVVCLIFGATLPAALLAASAAEPPVLEVADCLSLEAGTPVSVIGVIVDIRLYDSGTETLLIMDRDGGCCIRVVCSPHRSVSLQTHLRVADLVRVEGAVSRDASDTILFASKDRVSHLTCPQFVLSVDLLCENWRMFEFDRFNVSGELVGHASEQYLKGLADDRTILIRYGSGDVSHLQGEVVTLDCTLLVDQQVMVLFLRVYGISV